MKFSKAFLNRIKNRDHFVERAETQSMANFSSLSVQQSLFSTLSVKRSLFSGLLKTNNPLRFFLFAPIIIFGLWLTGCDSKSDPNAGKEEIASYGDIPLFREELDYFLPQWENQGDSARLADRFIEDWMQAQAIAERARNLIGSSLEEEVIYKRNDFERSLIEFKLSQYLIQNQLDTDIKDAEIRNYYTKHPDKFISQTDYYAHFFVKTKIANPSREVGWMRATDRETIGQLKKWSEENATEFKLDSSFVTLTNITSVLEGSRLNLPYIRKGSVYTFSVSEDENKYFVMFKLLKEVKQGELMPLSTCREIIKDILLNQRKNRLVETTKEELLKNAKSSGKVKILGKAEPVE